MSHTQNAAPETPKEQREPSVAEISKLTPQDSVSALEDKLEEKNDALQDLTKEQTGRNKEIAVVAQQSIAERLKLIRSLALTA